MSIAFLYIQKALWCYYIFLNVAQHTNYESETVDSVREEKEKGIYVWKEHEVTRKKKSHQWDSI